MVVLRRVLVLYSMKFSTVSFSFFLCLITIGLSAQNYRFEAGFTGGVANYLGDIGGKNQNGRTFISDLQLKQTSFCAGGYAKYALSPCISLRVDMQYGRLRGADSLSSNPGRNQRNLSFRNDIKELGITADIDLYEAYNVGLNSRYRVDFTFYGTIGLGMYKHNPQAYYEGAWVNLQPLQTEGYKYALSSNSVITGLGFDFTLDRNYKIGFRFIYNTTETDHLDDVKWQYAGENTFKPTPEGALAAALSDRRTERDPDYVAGPSDKRGNDKNADAFFFTTVNFSYVFKGKGGKYKRQFHNGYIRNKGKRVSGNRFFAF